MRQSKPSSLFDSLRDIWGVQAKSYLSRQVAKGMDELRRILLAELKHFLAGVNLHEEIQKALMGLHVDIQATIKLQPSDSKKKTKITFIKK